MLVVMSEGCKADRSRGRPVTLQEQLQTLTGIIQITVPYHQRVRALREREREGGERG